MKRLVVAAAIIVASLVIGAMSLEAQSQTGSPWRLGAPQAVVASAGMFEPIVRDGESYEVGAELQFAPRRFGFLPRFVPELMPIVGVMASAQGSLYSYGGLRFEVPLGRRFVLGACTGAGLLYRAASKDLGGPLEFRSGLEVAYRLPDESRIGLTLYHLSNAGLAEPNPGSESLVLTYTSGLGRSRR